MSQFNILKSKSQSKLFIATKLNIEPLSQPEQAQPFEKSETVKNIFKLIPSDNEFKQERGPRFDKHGEILKYTLVGKPDWYQKYQTQGKKLNFDENALKAGQGRQVQAGDERTVYRPGFDARSMTRKITGSERKQLNRMKEQIRTKNQILDEIDSIKARIEANKMKEDEELHDLPELSKRQFIKQQALFDKHKENEETWTNFVARSSSILERDPGYSQLVRAEAYRTKLETAQTFDVLKSDFERFGTRVWYMTLRKSDSRQTYMKIKGQKVLVESDQHYPLIISEDLPDAFRHSSLGGVKSQLEYIRKPMTNENLGMSKTSKSQISSSHLLQTSSSLPFQSFRSDQYLMQKMSTYQKHIAASNMMGLEKISDIDALVVQGKNQFDAECDVVYKDPRDGLGLYKKYVEKPKPAEEQDEQQQPKEEMVVEDYTSLQKLKLPPVQQKQKEGFRRKDSLRSSFSHVSGMNISGEY